MALLHIAEPGMSTAPHQHRRAVGIDLGTTNSLVASVQSGTSAIITDATDHALLPSVVRYRVDGQIDVGQAALAHAHIDPANTIVSVKRFMGRGINDFQPSQRLPYRLVDAPGMVAIETCLGRKTPVEMSAEILKTLRRRAEAALGGELAGAVITVPAYFDDAQRQATRDAARLAGLHVLRLLNEPTAAAIAYGLDNSSAGIYAVYDLGGGTFDMSILRMQRGIFEVLSTSGDAALGGDDFDRRIGEWLIERAGINDLSPQNLRVLLSLARRIKETLSTQEAMRITLPFAGVSAAEFVLTQAQLWALTQDLVSKTLAPVHRALRDAELSIDDIDGVILVGGATRMPHVQRAVAEYFKQAPLTNLDPDQVVALGAAMQANKLAGNHHADDWLLLDVIPLSLGIETMGGLVEKIIPRNSTLPVARAQEFTTYKDGQTAMSMHVVQGERELVSHCRSLARFELRGIPPMAAGAAHIRVTFQVDADGLLSVAAREQSSGIESAVTVKPAYGLSDDDIARMLTDSQTHAGDDMVARALREQQVEAQRLLEATQAALDSDGDALLSKVERSEIATTMSLLKEDMHGADAQKLHQSLDALNRLTTEFAARRMNRGIQRALSGRHIAELGI
ncbi:MAG: Fe-S protein assembly chaperone HscA [Pseudomonadota bacterium]